MINHSNFLAWVSHLQRCAIRRGDALVFERMPLFVAVAYFLRDEDLIDAYSYAIDDGYGDPVDLDADNRLHSSRLDDAIFARAEHLISIRELLTIEWFDASFGPRTVTICVVNTPEEGLLVLHDEHGLHGLCAVAIGPVRVLQSLLAEEHWLVLPRLATRGSELIQVVVRTPVAWSFDHVAGIVDSVVGMPLRDAHLIRSELLDHADFEDSSIR